MILVPDPRQPGDYASLDVEIRPATHDDYEAVVAFTEDTWSERNGGDYIPSIYHEWIDKESAKTLVADAGDELAGIAQVVALNEDEAWCQGMRTNPDYRGQNISVAINLGLFEWARERGVTIARNMVFSWNTAGLGASRGIGYEPATEFRWATPDPDHEAEVDKEFSVVGDPGSAWTYWSGSEARDHLKGLALSTEESWAVDTLTRETLTWATDETALLGLEGDRGMMGMAFRTRDYEREDEEGETTQYAEYGVGAWEDIHAARSLFAAIAHDAAGIGADETRVLIPETARHVSDTAYVRADISEDPDFVMEADLTAEYPQQPW
ncbi:MAG: GNAT superfamily N-acetyltransferase [Halobacteriales archaeon]